jgi:hypothetical protein
MQLSKLREFLDSRHIKYLVLSHSLAYTAQGIAAPDARLRQEAGEDSDR